jgi:predicted DNA-binding ribbon-helix-helix protein
MVDGAFPQPSTMCQIFINADPELYATRSRSIRLHGVATSLRLENLFWQVLEEIGERDGLSVPQLVGRLYDELLQRPARRKHELHVLPAGLLHALPATPARRPHPRRPPRPDSQPRPAWVLAAERRPS